MKYIIQINFTCFLLLKIFSDADHLCKSLLNFVTVLLPFSFFDHKAHGILAPQPGIEPTPLALEGKILTTGQPGKFLQVIIFV